MENPFEIINERLERIEKMLYLIQEQTTIGSTNNKATDEIMNIKQLTSYLGITKSYIYKLTAKHQIPFYKRGKILYFDRDEINAWIKEYRIATVDELERQATNHILKKPMKRL